MHVWKKVLIGFVIGLLIGSGVVFWIGSRSAKGYKESIERSEEIAKSAQDGLTNVQGDLKRYAAGFGDIANSTGSISDEIGRTAETIAGATDGIDSVIDGLERSIQLIEFITDRVVDIEAIITGINGG